MSEHATINLYNIYRKGVDNGDEAADNYLPPAYLPRRAQFRPAFLSSLFCENYSEEYKRPTRSREQSSCERSGLFCVSDGA